MRGPGKCGYSSYNKCMNIEQNTKWEALISILGKKKKETTRQRGKKKKKIVSMPAPCVELSPSLLSRALCIIIFYYMTSSVSGQDEANLVL